MGRFSQKQFRNRTEGLETRPEMVGRSEASACAAQLASTAELRKITFAHRDKRREWGRPKAKVEPLLTLGGSECRGFDSAGSQKWTQGQESFRLPNKQGENPEARESGNYRAVPFSI